MEEHKEADSVEAKASAKPSWPARAEALAEAIYDHADPVAEICKAFTQMLIGFGLLVALVANASAHIFDLSCPVPWVEHILTADPLRLVSFALMYAAGVELCHMLYTKGPDEAVNPVILGLASAVLLTLSDENTTDQKLLVVPLLILSMGMMFLLHEFFIKKDKLARAKERQREREAKAREDLPPTPPSDARPPAAAAPGSAARSTLPAPGSPLAG